MSENGCVTFNDVRNNVKITIMLAFVGGIWVRIGEVRYLTKNLVYCGHQAGRRAEYPGNYIHLVQVEKKIYICSSDAHHIIPKLRILCETAGVVHNLPPSVRRDYETLINKDQDVNSTFSVRSPSPSQRTGVVSSFEDSLCNRVQTTLTPLPPTTPPPGRGVTSGGQARPDISSVICVSPPPNPRPLSAIPQSLLSHTAAFSENTTSPTTLAPSQTRSSPQDCIEHISSFTNVISPRTVKQPNWVWHELQKRETMIRGLKEVATENINKVSTIEVELAKSQEKEIEAKAFIERIQMGALNSPDSDELKPQPLLRRLVKRALIKRVKRIEAPPEREDAAHVLLKTIRQIQQETGDVSAVLTGLDALKNACGHALMYREMRRWATNANSKDKTVSAGAMKYGDGIEDARPPEQVKVLHFYEDGWSPVRSVRQTVEDISSWRLPSGLMWLSDTIVELSGNADVIQMWHSHGMTSSLVFPLVAYSSSLFHPIVWVYNNQTKGGRQGWEVITSFWEYLEQQYHGMSRSTMQLDPTMFKSLRGTGLVPSSVSLIGPQSSVFETLDVFKNDKFTLVRYENTQRGSDHVSPLNDTVLWLPLLASKSSGLQQSMFTRPLDQLPPPGLTEYLFSRMSSESQTWCGKWTCRRAVGPAAVSLMQKCLDTLDQQKVDQILCSEFCLLLKDDDALVVAPGRKSSEHALFVATVKLLVQAKLPSEKNNTPQHIAHALDVQKLVWNRQTFCISLQGAPFLVAEVRPKPEMVELQRLKNPYQDQVYWHINAAMRNYQFNNVETSVTVNSDDVGGVYSTSGSPTSEECISQTRDHPITYYTRTVPPYRKAYQTKDRRLVIKLVGNITHAIAPEKYGSCLGCWMLGQVKPLQFYLDAAVGMLRKIPSAKLPFRAIPPSEGVKNYRGLANVMLDRRVYDTGKIVLWGQYSSSSIDRGVASAFAKGDATAAVFTLLGRNCVCISQWSRFSREHEWIYPPNTIFKVTQCLSEEHQMILDKANLQLFSMEEVDEYDAIEIYLRGLVPLITGNDAPQYVMQLFNVIHHLSKRCTEAALSVLLSPNEQALFTEAGLSVARRLMSIRNDEDAKEQQEKNIQAVSANLQLASENGNETAAQTLLDLGADVESTNEVGRTPIQLAALGGHYEICKILMEAGADAEVTHGGFNPLELAALRSDHKVTELFRERCPHLADTIPDRLERFRPRVLLPDEETLRHALTKAGLKWDKYRRNHCGQIATVVLYDRTKGLFWLEFDDVGGTAELYPASVLQRDRSSDMFSNFNDATTSSRRPSKSGGRKKSGARRKQSASRRVSSEILPDSRRRSVQTRRFSTASNQSRISICGSLSPITSPKGVFASPVETSPKLKCVNPLSVALILPLARSKFRKRKSALNAEKKKQK